MVKRATIIEVILGLIALLLVSPAAAQGFLSATVKPKAIHKGTFFNGTEVTVSGAIDRDADVIIRLTGPPQEIHLKKKGRALGVLWMNLGSVSFKGVPAAFIFCAPKELLASSKGSSASTAADLGLSGLKEKIEVESSESNKKDLVLELLKLKEKEGLYREEAGGVQYSGFEKNRKSYLAHIPIPPRLASGRYSVEVYALRKGQIIASRIYPVEVKEVGAPAFLSSLAFTHGTLYGIMATVVAIVAGLLMGVIFGGGKGAH